MIHWLIQSGCCIFDDAHLNVFRKICHHMNMLCPRYNPPVILLILSLLQTFLFLTYYFVRSIVDQKHHRVLTQIKFRPQQNQIKDEMACNYHIIHQNKIKLTRGPSIKLSPTNIIPTWLLFHKKK